MKTKLFILGLLASLSFSTMLNAHCQIPCGIYGDKTRFDLLSEHITTIEKSMKKVNELSTDFSKHTNQVIRWVQNKEQHADKFTEILTQYFLSQRIKANKDEVKYVNHLKLIHHLMVLSMKSKQSTDLEITSKMKKTLAKFEASYFNKKALKHLKEHK